MKYYLIIGYRTYEKYWEFGKIQVFGDGKFIDEFKADNEYSFTHKKVLSLGCPKGTPNIRYTGINYNLSLHDPDNTCSGQLIFDCPKKFQIIEINEEYIGKINRIQIKVTGGPSNNANGFMNKANMVQIFPVFLFPENVLWNKSLTDEIYRRHYRYSWKKQQEIDPKLYDVDLALGNFPHDLIEYRQGQMETMYSGDINDPTHNDLCKKYSADIQWPGPNFINLKKNGKTYHTWIGQPRGGDYGLEYYVHKKHKIYFLHTSSQISKPRILLNMIWYSLIEKLQKAIEQKP